MSRHIPARLRRWVRDRAEGLCEYCLVHEEDSYFDAEVDHVISEKHGGLTVAENLAYACPTCNRAKGSDLGSVTESGSLVRFFNPRTDRWSDHFRLVAMRIVPLTEIAEVTVHIFGLNDPDRLEEREFLHERGRYPVPEAKKRLG
jgi:hypothetical protein